MPESLAWWRILVPVGAFFGLNLLCWRRSLPLLRIVVLCCWAFVGYGVIQDQVSARLCPEYFTVGHPPLPAPLPNAKNSTFLALMWGFLGGFPGGIVLGIPLALAANVGPWPKIRADELKRPVAALLLGMFLATLIAGASSWYNSAVVDISIGQPWKTMVAPSRQRWFFIVACAHFATYLGALTGGLGLCSWIVRQRFLLHARRE